MSVTITLRCDGCDATTEGTTFLSRTFDSLNGKGHGFGRWRLNPIDDVVPEGWTAFDPLTNCTYCQKCCDAIFGKEEAATGGGG